MNRVILAIMGMMAALVLGAGVLVIVLVVGGGGDGDGGRDQTREEDGDADGGSAEGELRLRGAEPLTLDPHGFSQDADSARYLVEIYGGLLTMDPDLQILPDLAEEIPTEENGGKVINPDGTVTYTFRLREGVLFHDRKPVRADDVKYSLERVANPATQSIAAQAFLGDIVGVFEKLRGEADEISGVQVLDDRTIAITIDQDKPYFLFKLTYPTAFVVDRQQVERDPNWTRRPNGTGPYQLREWRFGERIILEANEHYHLGAPKVQTVRFLLAGSSITLYEAGEVDVAGVALDDLERVQDPADPLNAEYQSGARLAADYLRFNANAPPFDDPKVRQAFAMAIDLEQIARVLYQDAIPVASSILMPGLAAYNEAAQAPQFDPELARELLAQSSYGGPEELPEIFLAASGAGATAGPFTAAVIQMWEENLGATVMIEQAETALFFDNVERGVYQLYFLGWIMDYPDEENLLNLHFDSDGANNYTGYRNPAVDDLLRQALAEPDAQQRTELYQQAEQLILDDAAWFPLFFDRFHLLVKPYVKDYVIPLGIVPRLRFVDLEAR